jgi:dTMP kinase
MTMRGKLIVIDGLDGSGKKTQLDLLVKYCENKRMRIATLDFPQYYKTFFGRLVGRYLKGEFGSLQNTNPYLTSLLYAGDRWQARPTIEQALKRGRLLLTNRYVSSSLAFMAAKFSKRKEQNKIINWLRKLEYEIYALPQENLLIYLSVPPSLGQKLVLNKGKRKYVGNKNCRDIHEENLVYLKRVQEIYLRLVKLLPHWVKIDCLNRGGKLKTREAIHQLVLKTLKDRKILLK